MHAPMWVHHYLDALGYVHAHCYVRVRHYVVMHLRVCAPLMEMRSLVLEESKERKNDWMLLQVL